MSGLPNHLRPITIDIPATSTAEQALAVFDLLAEQQQTPDADDSGAERPDTACRTP